MSTAGRAAAGIGTRRWENFTASLWRGPWAGARCYFCDHLILRGYGEVQHQVSPDVRPDLAWDLRLLKPVHGSGPRRCPQCLCACNAVGAGNLCPRGPDGLPAPWDAAFIAARSAEAARKIAAGLVKGPVRRLPAATGRPAAMAGRPW
jgi:hypothetical protein